MFFKIPPSLKEKFYTYITKQTLRKEIKDIETSYKNDKMTTQSNSCSIFE